MLWKVSLKLQILSTEKCYRAVVLEKNCELNCFLYVKIVYRTKDDFSWRKRLKNIPVKSRTYDVPILLSVLRHGFFADSLQHLMQRLLNIECLNIQLKKYKFQIDKRIYLISINIFKVTILNAQDILTVFSEKINEISIWCNK